MQWRCNKRNGFTPTNFRKAFGFQKLRANRLGQNQPKSAPAFVAILKTSNTPSPSFRKSALALNHDSVHLPESEQGATSAAMMCPNIQSSTTANKARRLCAGLTVCYSNERISPPST